ncbi:MAG: TonB family protein [Bacteroidota bacterium]
MKRLLVCGILGMLLFPLIAQETYHDDFSIIPFYNPGKKRAKYYRLTEPQGEGTSVKQYYKSNKQLAGEGITVPSIGLEGQDVQVKHGEWKYFHENGNTAFIISYEKGEPIDTARQWHADGKLALVGIFEEGLPFEPSFKFFDAWDEKGQPLIINGEGEITMKGHIYPDPNYLFKDYPVLSGKIADGRAEGVWTFVIENDIINAESEYVKGKYDGVQKIYREDGSLSQKGHYEKGYSVGIWECLNYDGSVYFSQDFGKLSDREPDLPRMEAYTLYDEKPEPLNLNKVRKAIRYPYIARKKRIEGVVIIAILVDRDGNPVNARVIREAHPVLAKAVTEQIFSLRFDPAERGGEPIGAWTSIPFYLGME